jgi:hypothetical protein
MGSFVAQRPQLRATTTGRSVALTGATNVRASTARTAKAWASAPDLRISSYPTRDGSRSYVPSHVSRRRHRRRPQTPSRTRGSRTAPPHHRNHIGRFSWVYAAFEPLRSTWHTSAGLRVRPDPSAGERWGRVSLRSNSIPGERSVLAAVTSLGMRVRCRECRDDRNQSTVEIAVLVRPLLPANRPSSASCAHSGCASRATSVT